MKLPVLDAEGKELHSLDVDDAVFGIEPNMAVLHQAFVRQRNNQRAGTASTKTRGLVQGSTRKIRMQKYTGRARQGSIRAPHHVGGGVVFGPHPRDYSQAMPKKMRRLAIRSALSGKVADGQLIIIDRLAFPQPKTKEVLRVLRNVGIIRSALIVTGEPDRMLHASARNLQKTKVLPASYLNVADMLNHTSLLMTEHAVRVAERLWGHAPAVPEPAPEPKAKGRKAAKAVKAPEPAPQPKAKVRTPAKATLAPEPEPQPKVKGRRAPKVAAPDEPVVETAATAPTPRKRAPRVAVKAAAPEVTEKPPARAKRPKAVAAKPKKPAAAAGEGADTPKPRTRARKTKGEA